MLFPANSRSRRAGRTRRGGRSGPVLSLVRAVGVQTSGHMAGPGVGASGPGGARAGAANLEKDQLAEEREEGSALDRELSLIDGEIAHLQQALEAATEQAQS